jgi:thioredoxin 1
MIKILKFEGTWCAPCRAIKSILASVSKETGVEIQSIDVDKNENLVNQYNIKSVPTLIFIKDDTEVERISGFVPKDKIISLLEKHNK